MVRIGWDYSLPITHRTMKILIALFLVWVLLRGADSIFSPAPKKQDKGKCKSCGVPLEAGEDVCWHCEIVEYRKWRREKK